jgi:poly-gamma-glutamate capsule biosynthesis protein CapA/YwtB (metallophosphatase superfamily)
VHPLSPRLSRWLPFLAISLLPAEVAAENHPVSILFVGDIMLDGGPGHLITNGGDPFAQVAPWLRGSDLTIGNLECAVVDAGEAVYKPFTFKGPKAALPLLKKYFSAVSLANNHSGDWGKVGFASELTLLRETKLPWFGGGSNVREAHQPLILTSRGRRIAMLGYNDFQPRSFAASHNSPGTAWLVEREVVKDIRAARAELKADLVLLFLHWGNELEPAASPEQQLLARRLIDHGADAIIGSHSHVTQGIEWYQGHPVVYSLGNFVFDYFPNDPPVWRGWMVKLTFGDGTKPELEKYTVELDPRGVPHIAVDPQDSNAASRAR